LSPLLLLALAAAPVTVSLDLRGVEPSAWKTLDGVTLERAALVRLVQEGFSVSPLEAGAAVRLAVLSDDGRLVTMTDGVEAREVRVHGRLAEVHLELVQKLAELARAASARHGAQSAASDGGVAGTPTPLSAVVRERAAFEPRRWLIGVGADAELRPAVDPSLRALVAWSAEAAPWGLLGEVSWSWSGGQGGLRIDEVKALVGPQVELAGGPRWGVRLAALVGALLHHWLLPGAAAATSGVRVDGLLGAEVFARFNVTDWLWLGARVAGGLSTSSREHLQGTEVLWTRDLYWVELGALGGLAL